jgi:hypothetical protein
MRLIMLKCGLEDSGKESVFIRGYPEMITKEGEGPWRDSSWRDSLRGEKRSVERSFKERLSPRREQPRRERLHREPLSMEKPLQGEIIFK